MNPREVILSALRQGTLAGSWLLTGPEGVGKKDFALRLGGFLSYGDWNKKISFSSDIKWIKKGLTEEAKKEIQKKIVAGKEVSQQEIDAYPTKKEITIDEIREAIKFMMLTSGNNAWRLIVISLADDMNEYAQNALLKMLEEPKEKVILLLLCQNKGTLLPTIVSRCRQLSMSFLPKSVFFQEMKERHDDLSEDDLQLLGNMSQGSLGKAEIILSENGLELMKELSSFLLPLTEVNSVKLLEFCGTVSQEPKRYKLVEENILIFLKNKSLEDEKFLELYADAVRFFKLQKSLNLDKKHTLFIVLAKIGSNL